MKTEYLIPIDTSNGIATTCSSFNNLLMSNNDIKITPGSIKYKCNSYSYKLQDNKICDTSIVCYHMIIELNTDEIELDTTQTQIYQELLKNIRNIVTKHTKDFEILWDDISFFCSQKAYPLIYEIENLMRKLLTKFMLINVGAKWEKENIPSKINKSKNKDKDINFGNGLLYQLDFIELSAFLFEPYALKSNLSELKIKINPESNITYSLLEDYIPKSNWERYFSNIVTVENEHLLKKWQELYELRCKIAHNNQFTTVDYNKVTSIVNDLKPSIQKAINELDKIKIETTSKEIISENLAKTLNEQVGRFIIVFNKLYDSMLELIHSEIPSSAYVLNRPYPFQKIINLLLDRAYIDDNQYKKLKLISYKRNTLVHQTNLSNANEEIETLINEVNDFLALFNSMKGKNDNEVN